MSKEAAAVKQLRRDLGAAEQRIAELERCVDQLVDRLRLSADLVGGTPSRLSIES